ncbi:25352_t:CDS:2, partial [Gigaspora rosea]
FAGFVHYILVPLTQGALYSRSQRVFRRFKAVGRPFTHRERYILVRGFEHYIPVRSRAENLTNIIFSDSASEASKFRKNQNNNASSGGNRPDFTV